MIGAVVIDMGPAGEPLYPPAWTQWTNEDVPWYNADGYAEEVMWCYAENAQADFRVQMQKKYGTIREANSAWGKEYAGFAELTVPKPGQVRGRMWEDVLVWYRDSKRIFMDKQVKLYKELLAEYGFGDRYPILYLPGGDFSEEEWNSCIESGTATPGVKLACDNNYTVGLAAKYNCLLQYTGITGLENLQLVRRFMYENGYGSIPVFGENAGDKVAADDVYLLRDIIFDHKLYGIDYTHCHWLYEVDHKTPGKRFEPFRQVVSEISEYLAALDLDVAPDRYR